MVAVDTPDNLTARLKGAETMYVQVDAGGADAGPALMQSPGVIRVATADQRGTLAGYEVESERGTDIRRELARTIVNRGWGLLELRPMRMSLEEIFLQVTTEETPEEKPSDLRTQGQTTQGLKERPPCVTFWPSPRRSCAPTSRRRSRYVHHRALRAALRLFLLRLPRHLHPQQRSR